MYRLNNKAAASFPGFKRGKSRHEEYWKNNTASCGWYRFSSTENN
jgi:hypothetical protein